MERLSQVNCEIIALYTCKDTWRILFFQNVISFPTVFENF